MGAIITPDDPRWPNRSIKPPYGAVEIDREHPLAHGLSSYWLLNEGAGTFVRDFGPAQNHGTFGTNRPIWKSGLYGPELAFGNADTWIDTAKPLGFPNNAAIGMAANFTLRAGLSTYGVILSGESASPSNSGLSLIINSSEQPGVLANRGSEVDVVSTALTFPASHTVVYTRRSVGTSGIDGLSIDGGQLNPELGTEYTGNNTYPATNVRLGAWYDGQFEVPIDLRWVGVWTRVLTQAEATLLHFNPYCLLKPIVRRTYVFVAGATVVALTGTTPTAQWASSGSLSGTNPSVLVPGNAAMAGAAVTAQWKATAGEIGGAVAIAGATTTARFKSDNVFSTGTLTATVNIAGAAPTSTWAATAGTVAAASVTQTGRASLFPGYMGRIGKGTSIVTVDLTGQSVTAQWTAPAGTLVAGEAVAAWPEISGSWSVTAGTLVPSAALLSGEAVTAQWDAVTGTLVPAAAALTGQAVTAQWSVTAGEVGLVGAVVGQTVTARWNATAGALSPGDAALLGQLVTAQWAARTGTIVVTGATGNWPRQADRVGGLLVLGERSGGLR